MTRIDKGTVTAADAAGYAPLTSEVPTYDAMGNKTKAVTYNASNAILSLGQTSYDANDRPVCSVIRMNLASAATDACVPGNHATNGPDRVTKTLYDADGNVTDIIRAYGILKPTFDEDSQQTYAHYGYTPNGKKADETDARGNKTSLTYDKFDRLESLIYPSISTPGVSNTNDKEVYGYDPNGNRTSFARRGGQVYTYEYDALNRQILKARSDNTGLNVTSRYDLMGRLITAAFANGTGAITKSYDKLGRQLTAKDVNNRTISYQYDEASKRTYLIYPDTSVQQKYEYNTASMLTWTGLADGSVKITPNYDPQGRVTSIVRPNGANTTFEYDDLDRLASLVQNVGGTAKDVDWDFVRNPASQITSWSANNTVYDYVETQSKTDGRTYNGLNQDVGIAATESNTGYDLNGNLQKDGSRVFGYDIDNHLITVGGIATGTLEYDPLGRLSKTTFGPTGSSTVTTFLYDGVNLIGEYDAAGSLKMRYMHALGDDQPFAQFAGSSVAASNAKYLIANYQGSIIALADPSGNVADADLYKYGPWGEPKNIGNTDQWSGSRFRYTGQTIIPEARLYYYKARVYDPIMGRFLQTDPIGSKDDMDLYAYTAGDPVNKVDPTGLAGGPAGPGNYPGPGPQPVPQRPNNVNTTISVPVGTEPKAGDFASGPSPYDKGVSIVHSSGSTVSPQDIKYANAQAQADRATANNQCAPGLAGEIQNAGGGARLSNLNRSEINRIQNAANRTGIQITVVGSRASGTSGPVSDWDYVVPVGTPSRTIHSMSSSLPEGARGLGEPRNQDFFKSSVDTNLPYITFQPGK